MPLPLESAIARLDARIDKLGAPDIDTPDWWELQGQSFARSLLRKMLQQGLTTPVSADSFRRHARTDLQLVDPAPDLLDATLDATRAPA